jgi:hypothetical protein
VLELTESPSSTPSQLDDCIYLVIDASKTKGPIFREIAVVDTGLEKVIADFLDGQYVEPLMIVNFNMRDGWSRDASAEVARELENRALAINRTLPERISKFIAKHKQTVRSRA